MSTLKNDSIKATSWNYSKMLLTHGRTFIVSIVLARILEPSDFGLIGMAMIFASLTDTILDLGLGVAVIQKKEVTEEQKSTVFYLNMLMGVILGLMMYFTSYLVADFFKMPGLVNIIKFFSVTFLIKGLTSLQRTLMNKELDFKSPFYAELFSGIISSALGIYLALIGFGVWSLIYSQAVGWILNTIVIWLLSDWTPKLLFNLKSVKELWSFGSKSALTTLIDVFFNRIDTVVIGKLFDAATLGVFYKAKSLLRLAVQYGFGAFSAILFPAFSKVNDNPDLQKKILLKILSFAGFTTFLISGLILINAKEIITILYTVKWIEAVPLLKILTFFTFAITFSSIYSPVILSIGKSSSLLKIEIIKKIFTLCMIPMGFFYGLYWYLLFVNIFGALGLFLYINLIKNHFTLPIKEQLHKIIIHFIPFIILVVLSHIYDEFISLNIYINVIVKSLSFIIFYILYCFIMKSEGFVVVKDFILEKINKKKLKNI